MFVLSPGHTGTGQTKGTEMNTNTTAAIVRPAINKGDMVEVDIVSKTGTYTLVGEFISTNTKGVNIKVDGKTVSRALSTVKDVRLVQDGTDTPDTPADLFSDGDSYGAADIAAVLDMSSYDLRVILRDLGYGVGKGSRYSFDAGDATNVYRAVKNYLAVNVTDNA